MFPVGLVTRLGVSSPIVAEGKVIGFYDGWIAGRKFPVDMAGFAVNLRFYLEVRLREGRGLALWGSGISWGGGA